jgi:hypothetical protein
MKTVILTYCKDNIEAHRIQDVLGEQGILSILQNENIANVIPCPAFEIPIIVNEEDLEKAREILRDLFPEKIVDEDPINFI